jgi:hypothetical protein
MLHEGFLMRMIALFHNFQSGDECIGWTIPTKVKANATVTAHTTRSSVELDHP